MKKLNKFQIVNLITFIAICLFFVFEISKFGYYASVRPLDRMDWFEISSLIQWLVIFTCLFVFSNIFERKSKFRKTTFIFYAICSILVLVKIYINLKNFLTLFFPTEYYSPVFVDKFTSLFELCYISIFAIFLISCFTHLLFAKHFANKKEIVLTPPENLP